MSRGQENQVVSTATQQNTTAANNAQQSYTKAQTDAGAYEKQLADYAAANPYGQGGQYQQAENQVLSNTADAAGQSAGEAMQSQATRTGVNAGGAVAGTTSAEQANERALAGQEATANANRISSGATYGQSVLNASQVPEQMQAGLTAQQLGEQSSALNTQQNAASQPSTADVAFGDVLQAGQSAAAAYAKGGCWIAARLFGGWDDPRTHLVRAWIFGPFAESWYGKRLSCLYARHGCRVAEVWMPASPALTWILGKVFDAALRRARRWQRREQQVLRFRQWMGGR